MVKKNNSIGNVVTAGIGYTIGNILVKGISVISIFIFSRIMSVEDFGVFSTFCVYTSLFGIIAGLSLHSSIRNAKFDFAGSIDKYNSSLMILIIMNCLFFLVLAGVIGNQLYEGMGLRKSYFPVLIVTESFAMAVITFYNSVLAINFKYKEYIAISLVYAILNIGIALFLMLTVFDRERYLGRIIASAIVTLAIAIYILFRLFSKEKGRMNFKYWKYGLSIGIPLIPHSLSQTVLTQFDRLMIEKSTGSVDAGLYSFAYNIGNIFMIIAQSLDTAFNPWFFEKMEQKEYGLIKKVAAIYAMIVAVIACGVLLCSPELIVLLGGENYVMSKYVVVPIVLAMFYSFMYFFPAAIEYYYKKTKIIALGTFMAAVFNVVLNYIFIPRYGYIAAAYTTLFCYLLYYLIHIFFSYLIHKSFIYDMKKQAFTLLGVTAVALLTLFFVDYFLIRLTICMMLLVSMMFVGKKTNTFKTFWLCFKNK